MSLPRSAAACLAAAPLLVAGVLAGQEPDRGSGDGAATRFDVLPRVDDLIARHDCLACHDATSVARERLDPITAPNLLGLVDRVDAGWIVDFLEDPRGVRPGTTHPDQLAALPENGRTRVAEGIALFLASADEAGDVQPDETSYSGELERGRVLFHSVGCVACHGPLEDAYDLEITLVELEAELAAAADDPEEEQDGDEEQFDDPVLVRPGIFAPDPVELPGDLDRKYRLSGLATYLADPVAIRPSGHCPSMGLDDADARAVAAYLLRAQAQRVGGTFEQRPGLFVRVYEGDFGGGGGLARLDDLEPVKTKIVHAIGIEERTRDDQFGLRFSGFLDVPADGTYEFFLRSDDGSKLWVAGELVVDNGGTHAPATREGSIDLLAGAVPIEVTFFESGGGEELGLEWEGPDIERGELPAESLSHWPLVFRVLGPDGMPAGERAPLEGDDDAIERGRLAFARLGCATCHDGMLSEPPPDPVRQAPSLDLLAGARPGALMCLRPDGRYDFDEETVGELLSFFVEPERIAADATDPARLVERRLAGRRCYSCHRREGLGGVHPDVAAYFTGDEDAELGDQGRFPPTLTAVGRKFRPDVLRAALRGEEKVRPYLTTRMPRMGERGIDGLADLLEVVDDAADAPVDAAIDGGATGITVVDAGRRLAGDRGGLGCVQCHGFLGTKSLGVQAVDLGQMHRRLRFAWFRDLLLDPSNVDLDARMANLWVDGESPVQDIAEGDVEGQIAAIWCWLGEGDQMAPPPGLDTGPWAYEIDASDRVRAISVFMKDVSPRVVCVGTPDRVHFAFDEENVRLAKSWRGRFLNVEGTWKGRAGALETPASTDVIDFAPGLPVVLLETLNEPWPDTAGREADARILGRSTNADGSLTFRYAVGDLRVEETIAPTRIAVSMGRADTPREQLGIERSFVVRMPAGAVGRSVVARVVTARQFDRLSSGRWRIDGGEWPVVEVDEANAQTAQLIRPKRAEGTAFGANEEGRPSVDVRELGATRARDRSPRPVFDELRIPVLMAPESEGSTTLVGTFSWRYAW